MREVAILGIGQTPVSEHWDKSLLVLAGEAIFAALEDAGRESAEAIYVGNMLSGLLDQQEQLGALIADWVGTTRGVEAFKIEAACGSGAAAFRMGLMAVASGELDSALVVGVEKMTELAARCDYLSPGNRCRRRLGSDSRIIFCGDQCPGDATLHVRIWLEKRRLCPLLDQRSRQCSA